ncbi:MAG: preprotein translocase subunit YajC [Clostridia bacterium]|nr:preprotein translocase subunit YajC [Clostridia bacterium]
MLNFLMMMFEEPQTNSQWILYVVLGIMIVIMIVTSAVQRKKQKKQAEEMTQNLVIGSMITTIGGIVGKLIKIDEENSCYYIETGLDENKHCLQIVKNAIYSVHSKKESEEVIEEVTNEIK